MTQRLLTYGTMVQDLPMGGNFSVDADTTTGLTFGLQAGVIVKGDTRDAVAAGTVALTDDETNWVYISGTVVATNSGANPNKAELLYKVVTASGIITTITDLRGCIVTTETSF